MNGKAWNHIFRAAGLALFGGGIEDDDSDRPVETAAHAIRQRKSSDCCVARRPGSPGASKLKIKVPGVRGPGEG